MRKVQGGPIVLCDICRDRAPSGIRKCLAWRGERRPQSCLLQLAQPRAARVARVFGVDAAEVTSTVCFRLARRLLDPQLRLNRRYIWVTAKNYCIDLLRAMDRGWGTPVAFENSEHPDGVDLDENQVAPSPLRADDILRQRRFEEMIELEARTWPRGDRDIFERLKLGWKPGDIAKDLDRPEPSIKTRLWAIRKALDELKNSAMFTVWSTTIATLAA